jgi:hypothetical protein
LVSPAADLNRGLGAAGVFKCRTGFNKEPRLPDESILSDDFLRQLVSVGEVDVLIGVPTYNNAGTVGNLVQALDQAVVRNFARERVVIVNADGGSRDGTPGAILAKPVEQYDARHGFMQLRTVHRVSTRYRGHPSLASALRTILGAADLLSAKSCAVISPASLHVTPEWIENLVRPTLKDNFHYVAPLYKRNKGNGLLIQQALYPLVRAAYGQRIRELHAEDFGFSGTFAAHCLNHQAWHEAAVQRGPATWMAVQALSSGFRVCQSFLGIKSRSESSADGDAVSAIQSTIGTLFWCLDANEPPWIEKTGSEPVPTFGSDHDLSDEPFRFNRKRLLELFHSGVTELSPILTQVLHPETLAAVQLVAAGGSETVRFEDELWVRVLYDCAASYHGKVISRDHLLQLLTPLYRGRVCSILNTQRALSAEQIEQGTEKLCLEFERLKPYLHERWTAGSGGHHE